MSGHAGQGILTLGSSDGIPKMSYVRKCQMSGYYVYVTCSAMGKSLLFVNDTIKTQGSAQEFLSGGLKLAWTDHDVCMQGCIIVIIITTYNVNCMVYTVCCIRVSVCYI